GCATLFSFMRIILTGDDRVVKTSPTGSRASSYAGTKLGNLTAPLSKVAVGSLEQREKAPLPPPACHDTKRQKQALPYSRRPIRLSVLCVAPLQRCQPHRDPAGTGA